VATFENPRLPTNRVRAESFGRLAETYDRVRPSYPDALIDELVGRGGRDVLDVGCGTGKAAQLLEDRGLSVLGVEVDQQMAEVARGHGLSVETGRFEDWDPAGRRFDLLVSGQAWHWVEPAAGSRKAHAVLRAGGTVALFWNIGRVEAPGVAAIEAVYAEVVPGMEQSTVLGGHGEHGGYLEQLRAAGFRDVRHETFPWQQRYTRDEWLELAGTHSDHSTLPPDVLDRLLQRLGETIDGLGGSVNVLYRTAAVLARR
jgi:SAM-dependent methyltransferase